jgi:hemerythrin
MEFNKDFDEDKAGLKYDIQNFLFEWLFGHIIESDKAYSTTFRENGLT